jgi:FkbM family methyltransferase
MGVRLVPHFQEYDFQALIYRCLPYEPEVFRWLDTRDYRTVIEIGANVGVFSIFLARRFPQARVYAFEPSRKAFSRLLINAENNRCPNLVPFNAAVFSQSGFLTFHEPDGHLANGSLDRDFASLFSGKVKPVPVVAMSAVELESLVGEGPVLIKIDVEGVEPELLRTIQPLIARHRPDLLIEVLPYTEASLNELEFVRDGSYRLFRVEPQGLAPGQRFEAAKWRDWVALPSPASPNPGL